MGVGAFFLISESIKIFFRSQDLRAFEKLTDLKSESRRPSKRLNLGKELQVSPFDPLQPSAPGGRTSEVPLHPWGLSIPLARPTSAGCGGGSQPCPAPPTLSRREPRAHWNANSSSWPEGPCVGREQCLSLSPPGPADSSPPRLQSPAPVGTSKLPA